MQGRLSPIREGWLRLVGVWRTRRKPAVGAGRAAYTAFMVPFFILLQEFFMSPCFHAARWGRSTSAALLLLVATPAFVALPAPFQSALTVFSQAIAGDDAVNAGAADQRAAVIGI